ncbi:MAG: MMPL family transporter [Treponema sp.]|nr:MMPL family transporter [Treponema sp.]
MNNVPRLSRNKLYTAVWILFHAVIILSFLISLNVGRPLTIDADLFNMIPKPNIDKGMNAADEYLTEQLGQKVYILVANKDFAVAKTNAQYIYEQLEGSEYFSSISFYSDSSALSAMSDYVHQYRWNLLDAAAIAEITAPEGAEQFAHTALAKAYGAFTFSSFDDLENDPFMLGDYTLQNYVQASQNSRTAMSQKDGVLASFYNDEWYVMISGVLSKSGAALASKANGITLIYDVCTPLENTGTRIVYSGTPFYSHKNSTSAQSEISLISTVAFAMLIIVLLIVFGTPLPIVASVVSILISIATAFSLTHFIFGKISVLTLVFGTSLIGSCIDYSLHFFINWKGNSTLPTGTSIRNHLVVGLLLSLVSTEICYLMLVFAPFNLLKQMAVFSLSGILSSFLTVICLYPLLPIPKKNRSIKIMKYYHRLPEKKRHRAGMIVTIVFFIGTLLTLGIFHKNIIIKNDVGSLYTIEGRLATDAAIAEKILQYDPRGWFIVSGDSAEEVLQREEHIAAELRKINEGKPLGGYLATSLFIPSQAAQKRSRAAVALLLPYAEQQYADLGFSPSRAEQFNEAFEQSHTDFITPESTAVPEYLRASLSLAWLGKIDGKYYSIVLPASITDTAAYIALADSDPNVYFQDKMADVSTDLDNLTHTILILFGVAYIVIFVVLKFFYSWKNTLRIVSIPLLIVLVIVSVFAAAGIPLEFFSITGMILVFGLGLDYVIYLIENDKRNDKTEFGKLEPFAILLSFLTTAVSFGALALSTFVPVHLLGLSIFLGLTTAFICTLF